MDVETGICYTLLGSLIFALGFGAFAAVKSAASDGKPDFCYITSSDQGRFGQEYRVQTHRPWRSDETILLTHDPKEALQFVKECP